MGRSLALFVVVILVAFCGARNVVAQTPPLPPMPSPPIAPAPRVAPMPEMAPVSPPEDIEPTWDVRALQNLLMYPEQARRQRIQGRTILRVLVDKSGKAVKCVIDRTSGNALLDKAALDAVAQLSFTPAIVNERAVAVWIQVPVDFRLSDLNSDQRSS